MSENLDLIADSINIADYIEHTNLKADAQEKDIAKLCDEAIKYNFLGICILPQYISFAKQYLKKQQFDHKIKIVTVVGFPLGGNKKEIKLLEANQALQDGVDELDLVINIAALKDKKYDLVKQEISNIARIKNKAILKVIIETCFLNNKEIIKACQLCTEAGADCIKTSTGMGSAGATVENVKLIRDTIGDTMLIKAAGGINNRKQALEMINAGANRLGTSSGVKLLQ